MTLMLTSLCSQRNRSTTLYPMLGDCVNFNHVFPVRLQPSNDNSVWPQPATLRWPGYVRHSNYPAFSWRRVHVAHNKCPSSHVMCFWQRPVNTNLTNCDAAKSDILCREGSCENINILANATECIYLHCLCRWCVLLTVSRLTSVSSLCLSQAPGGTSRVRGFKCEWVDAPWIQTCHGDPSGGNGDGYFDNFFNITLALCHFFVLWIPASILFTFIQLSICLLLVLEEYLKRWRNNWVQDWEITPAELYLLLYHLNQVKGE